MVRRRHILVVEDDADLRSELQQCLVIEGYEVTEAASVAEAAQVITLPGRRFDLMILDRLLPDGDGRDLCAELRQQGGRVPIILLTGLNDEHEVLRGFDSGANDYITKPFRGAELMARVRVQMRLLDASEDAELTIGRFRFRPGDRQLIAPNGSRSRLTGKEAAVLKYLYHANAAVTRLELLQRVWGYHAGATSHTVETHIYRLRQKLETGQPRLQVLLNEDGGYRLYPAGISLTDEAPAEAADSGEFRPADSVAADP